MKHLPLVAVLTLALSTLSIPAQQWSVSWRAAPDATEELQPTSASVHELHAAELAGDGVVDSSWRRDTNTAIAPVHLVVGPAQPVGDAFTWLGPEGRIATRNATERVDWYRWLFERWQDAVFGDSADDLDVDHAPLLDPRDADADHASYSDRRAVSDIDWFDGVMDRAPASLHGAVQQKSAMRFAGQPRQDLHLAVRGMRTGEMFGAANGLGAVYLAPVGALGRHSSSGASPSRLIDAYLYELDGRWEVGEDSYVLGSFGQAYVRDAAPGFDRDLTWFVAETNLNITERTYLNVRYSEFGTYDSDKGYAIQGRLTGASLSAMGWDVTRLQRVGLTFGFSPRDNVEIKAEVGRDRMWVVNGSTSRPGTGHRGYLAFEVVVDF